MSVNLSGIPIVESIFLWAILAIFAFIFGFGYYAYHRQKTGNPIKGVILTDKQAWVGCEGQGLSLRISQENNRIRVRWGVMNYLVVILLTFIFGPGVMFLFVMYPEKINPDVPLPVWIMVGFIMLMAYVACANYIRKLWFEEPMFDVTREGVILLRSNVEVERFRRWDIQALKIEKTMIKTGGTRNSPARWVDNFTLILRAEGGRVCRLCITDNKAQIEQLKAQMESKLSLEGGST